MMKGLVDSGTKRTAVKDEAREFMKPAFPNFRMSGKGLLLALAAIVVFIASLTVNSHGIFWPALHPDEHKIALWMTASEHEPYIRERVYPEGLFCLARGIRYFRKEGGKVSSHVRTWVWQNGFRDRAKDSPNAAKDVIHEVRAWNVHFVAFSAVFVLLLAFSLFGKISLAVLAGLLYAFHPFVIEHAHYAETDAAMLFTGTLALLLMTVALKTTRCLLFVLASFAAGFAVATKYSLAPLLFLVPLNGFLVARRKRLGAWGTAGFVVLAMTAWCAGFLTGTPKLLLAPALFFEQAAITGGRTYGEMRALLGEAASRPHAATLLKFRSILAEAAKCSWYWWLFCATPAFLWFSRKMRNVATALPLFGGTYLLYAVFFFPWFRNQEFLPVLPLFALSAVLPFVFLADVPWRRVRIAGTVVAAVAVAAAMAWSFVHGVRMADAFAASEARYAVSGWLDECAPSGRKYIFEQYAAAGLPMAMAREGAFDITSAKKLEHMSLKDWETERCDYFLTAPGMAGRGTIDPATGALFPSRQRVHDAIMTNALELAAWHVCAAPRPMFAQVGVAFYANAVTNAPELDLSIPPDRPIVIKSNRYGNPLHRIPSCVGALGPAMAFGIVGKRTRIEFDPHPRGGKYYAVAVALVGTDDVEVSWDRGFVPRRQAVPHGRAVLFTSEGLTCPGLRFVPSARVRLHGDDQRNMCVAVVTDSPVVAAQVLSRFGNDAEAAKLCPFSNDDFCAAARLLGEENSSPALSFGGVPSRVVDDFACFRQGPHCFTDARTAMDPRVAYKPGFLYAEFPYVLGEGDCLLTLSFKPAWGLVGGLEGAASRDFPECDLIGAELLDVRPRGLNETGELLVDFHVRGRRRFLPFCLGIASVNGEKRFEASRSQLTWHPADAVRRRAQHAGGN